MTSISSSTDEKTKGGRPKRHSRNLKKYYISSFKIQILP